MSARLAHGTQTFDRTASRDLPTSALAEPASALELEDETPRLDLKVRLAATETSLDR
jgi:hypothetical protein